MKPSTTRRKVLALLRYWRPIMGLAAPWKINLRIHDQPEDEADDACKDAVAYIHVLDGYSIANLTINSWRVEDDLEHVVVHELAHVPTWKLRTAAYAALGERNEDTARAMVEDATEAITRALMRMKGKARR